MAVTVPRPQPGLQHGGVRQNTGPAERWGVVGGRQGAAEGAFALGGGGARDSIARGASQKNPRVKLREDWA